MRAGDRQETQAAGLVSKPSPSSWLPMANLKVNQICAMTGIGQFAPK